MHAWGGAAVGATSVPFFGELLAPMSVPPMGMGIMSQVIPKERERHPMPLFKDPADDIVLTPDPRLRTECEPITSIDANVRKLSERMLRDMYATEGCGLAAPQVGELVQMVVIDCDYDTSDKATRNPYVLINPKVVEADGEPYAFDEGCLSFPGITCHIERPSHVVVEAYDLSGTLMRYEAQANLMSVCLQHEIDHLHGVTMLDHLAPADRMKAVRAVAEAIAAGARPGDTHVD